MQVGAWKVLGLDNPSGPPASPVCAIKLEHPADPSVVADSGFHGRIFFCAGPAAVLPDLQYPAYFGGLILFQQSVDIVLSECIHTDALISQPFGQLCRAVRVVKACQCFCLLCLRVNFKRAVHQLPVNPNPARVDLKILHPLPLDFIGDGECRQASFDLHLRHDVLCVILLKQAPFFRLILRSDSYPPVSVCWYPWGAKSFNERASC